MKTTIAAALLLSVALAPAAFAKEKIGQTLNKQTIQTYMQGFRDSDHPKILACLTDDVDWILPGGVHLRGKPAFDKEIENPAFVGKPTITISRLTEENDVVVAEGRVQCAKKDGGKLDMIFADVFELKRGKIRKLSSFLMEPPKD